MRARRALELEIANDADLRNWAPKNFGPERPRGEIMTEWHVLRSACYVLPVIAQPACGSIVDEIPTHRTWRKSSGGLFASGAC